MSDTSSITAEGPWEVYLLHYARSQRQAIAGLIFGTFGEPPVDLPFGFVLARGNGRILLSDCGFMNERGGAKMAQKYNVPRWVSPLRLLAELGVQPEDVTDIVISHAHYDHMGSIDQFPKARIYLQKAELLSWIEVLALPQRFSFLSDVINPDDIVAAIEASIENRLTLLDGDTDDILPGIHVRLAPGHTMGQQFTLIDSKRGRYAVAGDCIYSLRNLSGEGCGHDHSRYVPLGLGIGSTWDQLKSFDRLEEAVGGKRERIIVLHDLTLWANFTKLKELEGFGIYQVA
jgi:glyoxylase-like metal-dependent hydrolase (beta-lactamase superfamily II)